MRRLRRNRAACVAVIFLVVLAAIAIVGDALMPHDANAQDLLNRNAPPSREHWLGTDSFGRDLLSRLAAGTSVTLLAALLALGVAVVLGVPIGLLVGVSGGMLDALLSRVTDGLLSLPPLVLAFAVVGVSGTGLTNAMVAVGIVLAPRFFRIARAAARTISRQTYVEAARADGSSAASILWRHTLPNTSGPLLVQISFALGFIVSAEASLSFIGLGVQPPQASWGSMLRESFTQVRQSPFPVFPPLIMIVLCVYGFAVIGDAIRDALGRGEGARA